MNRTQRYGVSQSHSSCWELIGHRRATDEAPGSDFLSAPNSFSVKSNLSEAWVSQPSGVAFQGFSDLQDGCLSLNSHAKGGLFPLKEITYL